MVRKGVVLADKTPRYFSSTWFLSEKIFFNPHPLFLEMVETNVKSIGQQIKTIHQSDQVR